MKHIIKYPKHRIYASQTGGQFYHFDDRIFNIGDVITGNDYSAYMDTDVIAAYSETSPNISNVATMLYCTSDPSDYSEAYSYRYTVDVPDAEARVLECSPVVCLDVWGSIVDADPSLDNIAIRRYFIELMANAYVGDAASKSTLIREFGFDPGSAVEYVADSGVVIDKKSL